MLIVRGPAAGDDVTGVVLDCKEMKVKGADVAIRQPDFEFSLPATLDPAKVKLDPIERPISTVRILPESDVFVGEQEVTLKSDTPGVVLTYTLDGTEPTPQSTPYTKPFKIDRTHVVKARAYCPGIDKNPPQTSGTQATPTSYALFTRRLASLPEQVTPQAQGLQPASWLWR